MTGKELRILAHKAMAPIAHTRAGWTDQELLADRLLIQQSSVQRWCSGANPVPERVAAWVQGLANLAPNGEPAEGYWPLLHGLPEGWQESRTNERDKQRDVTGTDADAGQRDQRRVIRD
jgi:hypothetical protein